MQLPQNYFIHTDKSKLDITAIHNFLSTQSYWAKDIPIAIVEKAIENSMCFGVYYLSKQIGFARVITDHTTFAYVCDVYIEEQHRGLQLGKCLVEHIMQHPQLQGLRRWSLATATAHGLYQQFGWNEVAKPERLMEIVQQDIYSN